MTNLFHMGGALFMSILSVMFLVSASVAVFNAVQLGQGKLISDFQLNAVKSIGLLALVTGILGQLIGIFSAFEFIEEVGEVTQAVLVGGLKVSSITTMYGILIFLISYLIWLGESTWREKLA